MWAHARAHWFVGLCILGWALLSFPNQHWPNDFADPTRWLFSVFPWWLLLIVAFELMLGATFDWAHQTALRLESGAVIRVQARVRILDITGGKDEFPNPRYAATVKVWNDSGNGASATAVVPWLTFINADGKGGMGGELRRSWLAVDPVTEVDIGIFSKTVGDPPPEERDVVDLLPNGVPWQVLVAEGWGTGKPWAAAIPLTADAYASGQARNLTRGVPILVRLQLRGVGLQQPSEWWFRLEYRHPSDEKNRVHDLALEAAPAPLAARTEP